MGVFQIVAELARRVLWDSAQSFRTQEGIYFATMKYTRLFSKFFIRLPDSTLSFKFV